MNPNTPRSDSPKDALPRFPIYDFSQSVGLQIKSLVAKLDKNNYRGNVSEIEKVCIGDGNMSHHHHRL